MHAIGLIIGRTCPFGGGGCFGGGGAGFAAAWPLDEAEPVLLGSGPTGSPGPGGGFVHHGVDMRRTVLASCVAFVPDVESRSIAGEEGVTHGTPWHRSLCVVTGIC